MSPLFRCLLFRPLHLLPATGHLHMKLPLHERHSFFHSSFVFVLFWPHPKVCRIKVPRVGVEHVSPAMEVRVLYHRTAREVSLLFAWVTHITASLPQGNLCLSKLFSFLHCGFLHMCFLKHHKLSLQISNVSSNSCNSLISVCLPSGP